MKPMDVCPEHADTSKDCKKIFCEYRNKKGKCSLDIQLEDRPYDVAEIAEILQISRQRIWRVYDIAISKLQVKVKRYYE